MKPISRSPPLQRTTDLRGWLISGAKYQPFVMLEFMTAKASAVAGCREVGTRRNYLKRPLATRHDNETENRRLQLKALRPDAGSDGYTLSKNNGGGELILRRSRP